MTSLAPRRTAGTAVRQSLRAREAPTYRPTGPRADVADMVSLDATLAAQSCAVIAYGAASGALLRPGANVREDEKLLGVGLLVAAGLTAVDAMTAGMHGLPLAGWAVLLFASLGMGMREHPVTATLTATNTRLVAFTIVVAFLLHWVHAAKPLQPTVQWGVTWRFLDLTCALALGWLAHSRRDSTNEARFLLAATAAGLGCTSFFGSAGTTVAASMQAVAIAPFLRRLVPFAVRHVSIAAAAWFAVALTTALRARTDQLSIATALPGLDDPLLVVAVMFACFGVALFRLTPANAPAAVVNETTDAADAAVAEPKHPQPTAVSFTTHGLVRDLRTPLTSMMATAGLMTATGAQSGQLEALQAYGRQLAGALADLDDFERLVRNGVDLAEDTYDFHLALSNCVAQVLPTVVERGIAIRLDISPTTTRWVQGDPSRVRQLLSRAIELAAQDCSIGPIDITASADETQLHVSILSRSPISTDIEHGFGMLYGKQLALSLGGELQLRHRSEGGIEIHITLQKSIAPDWEIDLVEEDSAQTSCPPVAARTSHGTLTGRVLLVDDSQDHQRLLGQLLARAGAEVTTAESGDIALHLLASMQFDLVLLDMQMPGKDGYTTIAELRQSGATVPVLALTADSSPADIERCLGAGCNGHLAKPIDFDLLRQTLAMHLQSATN